MKAPKVRSPGSLSVLTGQSRQEAIPKQPRFILAASTVVAEGAGVGGKLGGEGSADGTVVGASGKSKLFKAYEKGAEYFTNLFPVWLTVFSLVALKDPNMFAWFTTE